MESRWKKRIVLVMVGMGLVVGGFVGGRFYQDFRNGYRCEVLEEKTLTFEPGPLQWRSEYEVVGFGFIQPETTVLEFDGRVIYKARRGFQETVPVARNVRTEGKLVTWDDGEYAYHLMIEEVKKAEGAATRE